ncbi:hypothetical protein Amsp01_044130 [Amycolatopsis sp. NBRC 101858]|nr:hypothetical protein Amsp01_044130 [Amycolatopsis sp. NBRC 101858]
MSSSRIRLVIVCTATKTVRSMSIVFQRSSRASVSTSRLTVVAADGGLIQPRPSFGAGRWREVAEAFGK